MASPNSAILCVDDEAIILESLKEQLRRHFGMRYLYETANSADDAWGVIDDLCSGGVKLLLIVSDWLMPGIKGDEFLAQVHRKYPEVVTMLLTGQYDEAAVERARRDANLFACMQKPWNEHELMRLVASALP